MSVQVNTHELDNIYPNTTDRQALLAILTCKPKNKAEKLVQQTRYFTSNFYP